MDRGMGARWQLGARAATILFVAAAAVPCHAGIILTTSGNVATADISLSSGSQTYTAQVTITFDTVANLTAAELGLTAYLIDPSDPVLLARLPACAIPLLGCTTVDPNFPLMITVEPLNLPWLFASGFDADDPPGADLSFTNTYEIEVHTDALSYVAWSPYRLFKGPVNGFLNDITEDVLAGSVRARGRGGSFSQFLLVSDTRLSSSVETLKENDLQARIVAAPLDSALQANLLALLAALQTAVAALDYTTAIGDLDQLMGTIQTHAGIDVANVWNSDRSVTNDAGEILALAQTLRFTLVRLQNGH